VESKTSSPTLIEGLPRQRKYKDRANKKENGMTDELLGPRIKIESDWFLYEKPVTCIKKRRATRREEQREESQMRRASIKSRRGVILIQQRRRKAHFSENTEINFQSISNNISKIFNLLGGKLEKDTTVYHGH
jgi:hypothetical protein